MRYRYVAVNTDGSLRRGEIEALDLTEALESLRSEGLVPVEVSPLRRRWRLRLGSPDRRGDILIFTEQLERLLRAGVPLDRALNILARVFQATGKGFLQEVAEELQRKLERGLPLSQALAEAGIFPEFYVNLIRAGEISGALAEVLRDVVRYLREEEEFRKELQSALLYPAFLLIFGLLAVQTVLVYILPRFGVIFDELGVEPPLVTKVLLQVGSFWRAYGWAFLVLALLAFFYLRWWVRRPSGRTRLEAWLLKVPFLGRVLYLADMAKTFRGLAVMVRGGVSIPKAVDLAAGIPNFSRLREFLAEVSERLKEGQRLSRLFQNFPEHFDFVVNFVTLGEETGDMAQAFADMAYLCEEEVKMATRRFLTLIEPATILFFGLLLGSMIVSILMAIFDIRLGL